MPTRSHGDGHTTGRYDFMLDAEGKVWLIEVNADANIEYQRDKGDTTFAVKSQAPSLSCPVAVDRTPITSPDSPAPLILGSRVTNQGSTRAATSPCMRAPASTLATALLPRIATGHGHGLGFDCEQIDTAV